MNDEQSNTKLTEFRNWLIARLEARQDSPAMWYRFMKLKEALEDALGQASAEGQGHDRAPSQPKRPQLRLVAQRDDPDLS
jgi:hypothetical protein